MSMVLARGGTVVAEHGGNQIEFKFAFTDYLDGLESLLLLPLIIMKQNLYKKYLSFKLLLFSGPGKI